MHSGLVFFDFLFYFEGGFFIVLLWRSKYVVCFSFKNSILRKIGFAVSPSCYLVRFQVIYRVKFTHTHIHPPPQPIPELRILQGTSKHSPSALALPSPSSPFPPRIPGRQTGYSKVLLRHYQEDLGSWAYLLVLFQACYNSFSHYPVWCLLYLHLSHFFFTPCLFLPPPPPQQATQCVRAAARWIAFMWHMRSAAAKPPDNVARCYCPTYCLTCRFQTGNHWEQCNDKYVHVFSWGLIKKPQLSKLNVA